MIRQYKKKANIFHHCLNSANIH
uniref:Uncharacterized protein n=1 Tax=Arundo donax TaxID=35708 RepID=A0A0A8ZHS0_ARUDO